jgi:hypothetical protein
VVKHFLGDSEHIMVMERFQENLGTFIERNQFSFGPPHRVACTWVLNFCHLVRKMARIGYLGLDMTSRNVVVNTSLDGTTVHDMRLIDFGGGMCISSTCFAHLVPPDTMARTMYCCMLVLFATHIFHEYPVTHLRDWPHGPIGDRIHLLLMATPCIYTYTQRVLDASPVKNIIRNLYGHVDIDAFIPTTD